MRPIFRPLFACVAVLCWAGLPAAGQDSALPNLDTATPAEPAAVGAAVMAQDLFRLGMAQKDALVVLAAARLAASVSLTDAEAEPLEAERLDRASLQQSLPDAAAPPVPLLRPAAGGAPVGLLPLAAPPEGAEALPAPVTAADMRAAAVALAGEDETLLGLIDAAARSAAAGSMATAVARRSALAGAGADLWEVPFFGGALAEIGLVGAGAGNLDLLVQDDQGHRICRQIQSVDRAACAFVPARNGFFTVLVQNRSPRPQAYLLLTN